jgi:hypothetical protein
VQQIGCHFRTRVNSVDSLDGLGLAVLPPHPLLQRSTELGFAWVSVGKVTQRHFPGRPVNLIRQRVAQ